MTKIGRCRKDKVRNRLEGNSTQQRKLETKYVGRYGFIGQNYGKRKRTL